MVMSMVVEVMRMLLAVMTVKHFVGNDKHEHFAVKHMGICLSIVLLFLTGFLFAEVCF